jgi:putative redox protein
MIAYSEWQQGNTYKGFAEEGNTILFDADAAHAHGPSPMQAVLMALCACTSVDVVSILKKKRQNPTGLKVSATAEQAAEPPRVFTKIHLTYAVSGQQLSRKAVEDAVTLSKTKYCSVSLMLEKAAKIDYEIVYPDGVVEP